MPAWAQEPVVVRTSVKPDKGAVIGQRVALSVDVLFAGEMMRPPRVVVPETAGAQILRFESQATTMSDRIDGVSYIGQRFEFALYARRGGTLAVPAAEVSLLDRAGNVIGTATGQAVTVEIAVPPGVDAGAPLIATTHATLEEQWQPGAQGRVQGGRCAGPHGDARGRRRAGDGDAQSRVRRARRREGLRRSPAKR